MENTETVINSVLCFMNSANADYSLDSLSDVMYSFYSHDEIKVAKELLFNLLKKDLVWRRDPDKKRKDLKDLLDAYDEFKSSNMKVDLVTNSHKKMPPVGLELFAPILNTLAEDINKINELLPKILDIKSEVVNTADTVRQMKIDMCDLKGKFSRAIDGMKEAANDLVVNECNVIDEINTFRQSLNAGDDVLKEIQNIRRGSLGLRSLSYADAVTPAGGATALNQAHNRTLLQEKESEEMEDLFTLVSDTSKGAISKSSGKNGTSAFVTSRTTADNAESRSLGLPKQRRTSNQAGREEISSEDDWILVDRKNKKKRENEAKQRQPAKVTGSRRSPNHTFKAAVRLVDVFVGRVHKDVSVESITDYIMTTFGVKVQEIEQLEIRSDYFNAFKVTVKLNDRDKLFSADKWPEDILVNKFYSRSKNFNKERDS